MNIHTRLRALILVTLLPIAIFGVAGAFVLVEKERDTLARGLRDQARTVMSAVDTELQASVAPLQLLARSPALERSDLEAFRAEAQRALDAREGAWANLLVSDAETGEMLVNMLAPNASRPVSPPADVDTIVAAAKTGNPTVSKVVMGPILKRPLFAVRVPVARDGPTRYVLSAVVETSVVEQLIERIAFPPSWTVAVLDRELRFVARRPNAAADGDHASGSLRQALEKSSEGWERGTLLDGTPIYRAFRRSAASGWSTSIAIPVRVVEQDVLGTWLLVGCFIAAAALGLSIAWVLAARLSRPIRALAAAAPALGRGDASAMPPASTIDEVRELGHALRDAAVAIRDREARQSRAEQRLREADRAKDEFLAMLGHELRNPLASVANVARLLEFAERQPELMRTVRDILGRQVEHMTHLLDDLLEVGRMTGGKIRLERKPLDLAAVTGELIDAWRRGGRFTHHDVEASLAPAWVLADRVRIEQIVSNLLDNALKYTPSGGRIDVAVLSADGVATLVVRDTGEGIGEALIDRVFDLFVQGERGLAREKGGLGIGLTMAKRLVELHGGAIAVESPGVGHGATFTVSLPAVAAPADIAAATGGLPAGSHRILVVEDNDDARDSLAALLSESGHDVQAVASGEAGVALAAAWRPEIALVDIGLPDVDGYYVARRLRSLPHGAAMRIVALTGYGSPEDRQRAFSAGFDAHLVKPLDMAALEALLGSEFRVRPSIGAAY